MDKGRYSARHPGWHEIQILDLLLHLVLIDTSYLSPKSEYPPAVWRQVFSTARRRLSISSACDAMRDLTVILSIFILALHSDGQAFWRVSNHSLLCSVRYRPCKTPSIQEPEKIQVQPPNEVIVAFRYEGSGYTP